MAMVVEVGVVVEVDVSRDIGIEDCEKEDKIISCHKSNKR